MYIALDRCVKQVKLFVSSCTNYFLGLINLRANNTTSFTVLKCIINCLVIETREKNIYLRLVK